MLLRTIFEKRRGGGGEREETAEAEENLEGGDLKRGCRSSVVCSECKGWARSGLPKYARRLSRD
jgi:hypothetical protein